MEQLQRRRANARMRMRKYRANPVNRERILVGNRISRALRRARDVCSCVYIVWSPSDPSWIKVGQTSFPTLRMQWLKCAKNTKKNTIRVPSDSVYYYKQDIKADKRVFLEKLFLRKLKKILVPKSKASCNESFYIKTVEDLETARELLVEMAMFLEEE